eukprot:TRINITY_DN30541_c0_g1_i1.p1 TRINITY_DN30541_c0_g1~~TRINITY_DN30541_c0_g1_i1.p1  ORF type:complete len:627 (+),score=77.52 TRINITY_DN30541_c0_g1_i1:164-2044(+)
MSQLPAIVFALILLFQNAVALEIEVTVGTAVQAASSETLVFELTLRNGTVIASAGTVVPDTVGKTYNSTVLSNSPNILPYEISQILLIPDPSVIRMTGGDAACFMSTILLHSATERVSFECTPNPTTSYNYAGVDNYCVDYFHNPGQGISDDVLLCNTSLGDTAVPTAIPTAIPTAVPTTIPTAIPTVVPTAVPTSVPTSVPETMVPGTIVPETTVPSTVPLSVATSIAPTLVPVGTASPVNESTIPAVAVQVTPTPLSESSKPLGSLPGSYVTSTVLISSLATASASNLVLFASSCSEGADPELPRAFHITQISVGGSLPAGAVVVNGAAVIVFALLVKVLSVCTRCCRFHPDPDAFSRFPGIPLVGFRVLYQSLCYSAFLLIYYSADVGLKVLGVITLLGCVGVVGMLVPGTAAVVRHARYYIDPEQRSTLYIILFGKGEWVSETRGNEVVLKFGSLFKGMCPSGVSFPIIELVGSLTVAAISAIRSENLQQCGHIKITQAIVLLTISILQSRLMPYHRGRDYVAMFMVFTAQSSSLVISAVYHYLGSRSSLLGDTLLVASAVIISVKLAIDVVCEGYLLFTGRQQHLQLRLWERQTLAYELLEHTAINFSSDSLQSAKLFYPV